MRPIWFCLDEPLLTVKTPPGRGWKSLDFLDSLVRNEPFQWVKRGFCEKISLSVLVLEAARHRFANGTGLPSSFMSDRRRFHEPCRNHSTPFDFSEANVDVKL